ncbi:MAG: hypothetical protein U0787_20535 [Polyangia bacterium]
MPVASADGVCYAHQGPEITGFKSFCDDVVGALDDLITGVVGPNGRGKSTWSTRSGWCMGEQFGRYLRGKAMQDVIFSGSDKRGPLGFW